MMVSSPVVPRVLSFGRRVVVDSLGLYWSLIKIMIPVMIAVKVAVELGMVSVLGRVFAPVMSLVGLPAEMGIVWATTCLVNLYGGAAALLGVLPQAPLSAAQMTVLATMMLAGHGLPLEQRICQKAGASLLVTASLRLGVAVVYGALLSAFYSAFDLLQQPAPPSLLPMAEEKAGWAAWALSSLEFLVSILGIILVLILVLRLMDVSGATAFLTRLFAPILRIMGIGPEATPLTMVGVLLGLSYGGGLIIRESQAGRLPARDTFLAIAFLSICHSLIEDTLFMMALGGHWSGVLVGRFLFAVALLALMAFVVHRLPDAWFYRWLFPGGKKRNQSEIAPQQAG